MKARFITRCGCECIREVSFPPPPYFDVSLRPPVPNEGIVRTWLNPEDALRYDPRRDGVHRRRFKLSLESYESYEKHHGDMVWYDEVTDFDPVGYSVDRRTYGEAKAQR